MYFLLIKKKQSFLFVYQNAEKDSSNNETENNVFLFFLFKQEYYLVSIS